MRKAGILDESNRVFALNICDDAGTRMFTSVTQCLNYYTRVKAVEKFGIHDETGMVRIAYVSTHTHTHTCEHQPLMHTARLAMTSMSMASNVRQQAQIQM